MVHWGTLGSSQKSCFGPSFLGRIIKSFRRLHRSPFSHSGPTDPTNHKRSTFFCFGALECRESRPQHATSAVSKHVAAACLPHARHTTLSTSNTASLFPTCYPPGLKRFRSLAKHKVSETSMDRCFVCGTPLRPNSRAHRFDTQRIERLAMSILVELFHAMPVVELVRALA